MARILIIEDNPANMQLMVYLLQAFGHQPAEAHDGLAGLEAVRGEVFDLILCDLQLPDIDGFEFIRRLKADPTWPGAPVVAVTAFAMVGDREKVLRAGFDGYLSKPIIPQTFVAQLEAFLPASKRSASRVDPPAPHPATAAQALPKRITLLLVDNSFDNIRVVQALLEPGGYEVRAAQGVAEALALAREIQPDLILCNMVINGESSHELIRAVKADTRLGAVPIVCMASTHRADKDAATALQLGAAAYLTHPVEPQALLATLETHLKKT